jgi:thiol:disulfide interchange protein DsbD
MLNNAVDSGSVLIYFFIFAGGVLASFTPCTYPVLPLTVGYIGNMSGGSKFRGFLLSLTLVSGMALIYAVFGTIFATLGMQFGAIWGNGWAVFGIAWFFIVMSLFLLDIFTFPTPKFLYKLEAKVGGNKRQGFVGAFLVGGVSGLVVGPCTGPILAIVIVAVSTTLQDASGAAFVYQAFAGGIKLFLFGLGQGVLILLAGTFVGFLTYMPKSGQWMVAIKKAFAVLIIAGASLLLVYVGQATDFPELTQLISGDGGTVESADDPMLSADDPMLPENDAVELEDDESLFGGDQFLDD